MTHSLDASQGKKKVRNRKQKEAHAISGTASRKPRTPQCPFSWCYPEKRLKGREYKYCMRKPKNYQYRERQTIPNRESRIENRDGAVIFPYQELTYSPRYSFPVPHDFSPGVLVMLALGALLFDAALARPYRHSHARKPNPSGYSSVTSNSGKRLLKS
jgi:hypothetical protein